MGKIRLKTLGDDELEQQQAVDAKKRREVKKEKKEQDVDAEGSVESSHVPAEVAPRDPSDEKVSTVAAEKKGKAQKKSKSQSKKAEKKKGKKFVEARKKVDNTKKYSVTEAVKLIKSMSYVKFDETLEVHLKLRESGVKGQVSLPHGTGKELKVAIADDKLLKSIEAGVIDFDVLVTSPAFMPKLVQFARVLGPKGLMPNPKNGTVSDNPEEAAKKFKGGNVNFKAEAKAPLMHQSVGKLSFEDEQLVQNINIFLDAVQKKNVLNAHISGSMTPSVQIDIA